VMAAGDWQGGVVKNFAPEVVVFFYEVRGKTGASAGSVGDLWADS
jgi:hypothetical protein